MTRFALALRAFLGFLFGALVLGAGFYFLYDVSFTDQLVKYGFWSLLGAGFVALMTAAMLRMARWPRMPRFLAGLFIGGLFGYVFLIIAFVPSGFWPGPMELPALILWPIAGMIAVGFAASDMKPNVASTAPGSLLCVLLAIVYVAGVKVGLNQIPEPLNFARYTRPQVGRGIDKPFTREERPAAAVLCKDTVPVRQLSDVGIVMDSTIEATPLGVFSNVQVRDDGKQYGRRITLWRVGDNADGFVETFTGGEPTRAMIEVAEYTPTKYALHFNAFYEDGYYDSFNGSVYPGSMTGTMRTSQQSCADVATSTEQFTFTRDSALSRKLVSGSVREVARGNADVYRRIPAPSYPDPPSLDQPISIAPRFWHESGTSAASFTARFKSSQQLERWLSVQKQFVFARTQDRDHLVASWIVIGPSAELKTYTATMLRAYGAKDGMDHLSFRVVPVQLVF